MSGRCLIGCGIFSKEFRRIIDRNGWELDTIFLPSRLHVDLDGLRSALEECLRRHGDRTAAVFYGACHPCMDQILDTAQVVSPPGQNCIEMYLGRERFRRELEQGAYFIFEDWALNYREIFGAAMPGNAEVLRGIFQATHKYLLAIRTPCSGDFRAQAEEISVLTSLELRWTDVGLEHLEEMLTATLDRAKAGRR